MPSTSATSRGSDKFAASVTRNFELTKGYSPAGWFTPDRVPQVLEFAETVAAAYREALADPSSF